MITAVEIFRYIQAVGARSQSSNQPGLGRSGVRKQICGYYGRNLQMCSSNWSKQVSWTIRTILGRGGVQSAKSPAYDRRSAGESDAWNSDIRNETQQHESRTAEELTSLASASGVRMNHKDPGLSRDLQACAKRKAIS